MRFKSEEDRLKHPYASLIPENLWKDPLLFNESINEDFFPFMESKDKASIFTLIEAASFSPYRKEKLWFYIAASHPNFSPEELEEVGQKLCITKKTMLEQAILWNNINYFHYLVQKLKNTNAEEFKTIILKDGDSSSAFTTAIIAGHLEMLEYLEQASGLLISTLKAENYIYFTIAAAYGHLEILKYLAKKAPEHLQKNEDFAFSSAARNGHLEVLKYLAEQAPDQLKSMITARDYEAVTNAARNGHLEVLKYLAEQAPDQLKSMITARDYEAVTNAARNGHLEVLKYLAEQAPDQLKSMITARNYEAVKDAAKGGHLATLKYLVSNAPAPLRDMITPVKFWVFDTIAADGHLEILTYISEQSPGLLEEITKNSWMFQRAASRGHLHILKYIAKLAPSSIPDIIAKDNYQAFREAAAGGHLDVLEYLADQTTPQNLQNMIASDHYEAFRSAAAEGHLDVLEYLKTQSPDKLQYMIAEYNFTAFRAAVSFGHLEVVKYLADVAPNQLQNMLAANDYYVFHSSFNASRNKSALTSYLLSFASVFSHAEQHVWEYSRVINPLVSQKIADLQVRLEATPPNEIFDVPLEEANYLFFVLRNLIRRNDAVLYDDIRFLLNIPAVKNLVHREVTPGQSNELFRLALRIGNGGAAGILLTLPEVRQEAARHGYYSEEIQGGLNVRDLARDPESSMTALSTGEQSRLQRAIDHYNPILKKQGMVPSLMKELRELLEARFAANPAQIEIEKNGVKSILKLPFHWAEFNKLSLSPQEKKAALEAYYQHKDHTAWRYLAKPNPWMHTQAGYVYISDNRQERWSTFEDYQPLIALLFLGAKDKSIAPIEQFSFETRLEHFIAELALIGRAHNWDQTRIKLDQEGKPILDEDDNPIEEEFDDLEGDRPSCFSGVKRRLFQSLPGHPFFQILTTEIVKNELRDFVRDYWNTIINNTNRREFEKAWEVMARIDEEMTIPEATNIMKKLDISSEQQNQFIQLLRTKYGIQFTEDPILNQLVMNSFILNNPETDCHAIDKLAYAKIESFFEEPKLDSNESIKQANQFESASNSQPEKEDELLKETNIKDELPVSTETNRQNGGISTNESDNLPTLDSQEQSKKEPSLSQPEKEDELLKETNIKDELPVSTETNRQNGGISTNESDNLPTLDSQEQSKIAPNFHTKKHAIQQQFIEQLNELNKKIMKPDGSTLSNKDESLLFNTLFKAQKEFFLKLIPTLNEEQLNDHIRQFRNDCLKNIKSTDKIMGHGWLYRLCEVLIKAVIGLFVGLGMVLGSVAGKGLAKNEHRQAFKSKFFTLDQTKESKALKDFQKTTFGESDKDDSSLISKHNLKNK